MSKQAEEFYRNKLIEQAISENKRKFLKLVDFSKEAKIIQEYADQQLTLNSVVSSCTNKKESINDLGTSYCDLGRDIDNKFM